MAKCIGIIVDGIKYDPGFLPEYVVIDLQDKMAASYEADWQ